LLDIINFQAISRLAIIPVGSKSTINACMTAY
jgi:hypothetical protein